MNPISARSQIWIRRPKKYRDIYLQNKDKNAYKNLTPQNVELSEVCDWWPTSRKLSLKWTQMKN